MRPNLPPLAADPVVEAFKPGIDRTLLRANLALSVEERFRKHMDFGRFADALRDAGKQAGVRP